MLMCALRAETVSLANSGRNTVVLLPLRKACYPAVSSTCRSWETPTFGVLTWINGNYVLK